MPCNLDPALCTLLHRRSYLRADYAIECSDTNAWSSYKRVELLAWLGIMLYPVGVSVLYSLLLFASRRAILDNKPTPLSKALGFLVRDYEPRYMWWELLVLWRQLYLVGKSSSNSRTPTLKRNSPTPTLQPP